jgi:trehalose 6-phosphate synthase/phosphatase
MENSTIVNSYKIATKRLLLLDYDGVLAPIMPLPEQAAPNEEIYTLLEKLTADPRNTCVIVSGRPHETLDEWLGHLPLAFAAEHGLWRREPRDDWVFALEVETDWKATVRATMERYVELLPGSFLEEKHAGVGFHYRTATADDARQTVEELIRELEPSVDTFSLKLLDGKKVVEIIPSGVDKGSAANFWLNMHGWDFILAAGDDVTDEALFEVLPSSAYSIKVGDGATIARATVPSQPEFMRLLKALVVT